jgi:hypothetical protein
MTDYELEEAVTILKQRARKKGPQHALWDVILDAEAILQGRWSVLTREQVERDIERELLVR